MDYLANNGISMQDTTEVVFLVIAIFRGIIGFVGIIFLVYAFWFKFLDKNRLK
jgi:hypothetical protein